MHDQLQVAPPAGRMRRHPFFAKFLRAAGPKDELSACKKRDYSSSTGTRNIWIDVVIDELKNDGLHLSRRASARLIRSNRFAIARIGTTKAFSPWDRNQWVQWVQYCAAAATVWRCARSSASQRVCSSRASDAAIPSRRIRSHRLLGLMASAVAVAPICQPWRCSVSRMK